MACPKYKSFCVVLLVGMQLCDSEHVDIVSKTTLAFNKSYHLLSFADPNQLQYLGSFGLMISVVIECMPQ